VNALVAFVFSTTGVVTALVLGASWLWRRPRSSAPRIFLVLAAIFYGLASTYAVPALVTRGLRAGYHQFALADKPSAPVALVVLGSGTLVIRGWVDRADVMTDIAAARVLEAARVFRLIEPAVVVSSGGRPSPYDDSQPSGPNMRLELIRLGVPDSRIIVEDESRNTREEAMLVTPILRARGIDHVVLVTSDSHMRRALGIFRTYGWNPVPAIAPDPGFSKRWANWLVPSLAGLEFSRQVSRELIGLPYYWARGWWRS
jgi:uncharacterized SAM-binding protein YcdF (DUF218 family)